jgi:C-1 hydroxylase
MVETGTSGGEDAKAVVLELIEAWNALDRAAFPRLVHPSLLEEDYQHFDEMAAAFSELHATVEQMIAEGDVVAARLRIDATHDRGPFAGVEPTGKTLTWTSFRFYRVADGQLVASSAMQDRLGLFQQLGLVPPLEELVHWAADQGGEQPEGAR